MRLRLADILSNIRGIRAVGGSFRTSVAGVRTVTETVKGARPPRPARPSAFVRLRRGYRPGLPVIGTKRTGIVRRFVTPLRVFSTMTIS